MLLGYEKRLLSSRPSINGHNEEGDEEIQVTLGLLSPSSRWAYIGSSHFSELHCGGL